MKRKKNKKREDGTPDYIRDTRWHQELLNLKLEAFDYKAPPGVEGKKDFTVEEAQAFGRTIPTRIVRGWRFSMTSGLGKYQLSVSLHPRGRSSTTKDWEFLGAALAAIGVPEGKEPMGGWPKDANAVHHFWWDKPKETVADVVKVL